MARTGASLEASALIPSHPPRIRPAHPGRPAAAPAVPQNAAAQAAALPEPPALWISAAQTAPPQKPVANPGISSTIPSMLLVMVNA